MNIYIAIYDEMCYIMFMLMFYGSTHQSLIYTKGVYHADDKY